MMTKSSKKGVSSTEDTVKTDTPIEKAVLAKVESKKVEVKKADIGKLVSRVKFPVNIVYKNENIRMSPKAVFEDIDRSLLKEPTPLGVIFIPNNK